MTVDFANQTARNVTVQFNLAERPGKRIANGTIAVEAWGFSGRGLETPCAPQRLAIRVDDGLFARSTVADYRVTLQREDDTRNLYVGVWTDNITCYWATERSDANRSVCSPVTVEPLAELIEVPVVVENPSNRTFAILLGFRDGRGLVYEHWWRRSSDWRESGTSADVVESTALLFYEGVPRLEMVTSLPPGPLQIVADIYILDDEGNETYWPARARVTVEPGLDLRVVIGEESRIEWSTQPSWAPSVSQG
jgi:hypothetical protein